MQFLYKTPSNQEPSSPVSTQGVQMRERLEGNLQVLDIEFVGGPYDGHEEWCFAHPSQLPLEVVWFFGREASPLASPDEEQVVGSPRDKVALYALSRGKTWYQYRFVGAISVADLFRRSRETD